jgi:drug/metabolite transporter (DMT)-like permease
MSISSEASAAPAAPVRARIGVVDAALLAMCVLWASNVIALKLLLALVPPPALSAVRFLIAGGFGVALLAACRGPWRIAAPDRLRVGCAALLGVTLYQLLFMEGLHRTSAFVTNLLQGTEPVFALLLLRVTGLGKVSGRQWAGVLLSFVGTVLFFLEDAAGSATASSVMGLVLNLVGALVFSAYALVSAPLFERYPGRTVMAWTMGLGALPLLVWARGSMGTVAWSRLGVVPWATMVASSLLPVYVGFWIWNWAITRKGLAHASLYIFVDIVLSGVFAYALLGEPFGPLRLLGAAVIMTGIRLAMRGETR